MLEVRNETLRFNPAPWNLNLSRARKRKPLMAEKITFVGFLYELPEKQHPMEESKGWLVRVSGFSEVPEGVYSIVVYEHQKPTRVFASAARLVTGLPQRKSEYFYPYFGENEVSLSERTYDLKTPERIQKKLHNRLRRTHQGFKYVYV